MHMSHDRIIYKEMEYHPYNTYIYIYTYTLWLFNIAMENHHFQ